MNRTFLLFLAASLASGLGACSTVDTNAEGGADDANDGGSGATTNGFEPVGQDASTAGDGTSPQTGSDDGGPTGGTDSSFLVMPDGGGPINECNQWTQDCPEGEKCMPYANDGGGSWNATRCSEVAESPGQAGDACAVEGGGVSGLDDCDLGNMCYYVDPETNEGTCVSLCFGAPEAPLCDPGFACSISNEGVLTLCRAECDPLLQDCDNASCLAAAGADAFVCIVDASGEAGAPGDPCEFLNSCDSGNLCLDASAFVDCPAAGCCSEFCDITEPNPDSACSQPSHVCTPYFDDGEAPPQLAHVGICTTPA